MTDPTPPLTSHDLSGNKAAADPTVVDTVRLESDSQVNSIVGGSDRDTDLPETFGRYRIQRRLGGGAMGTVFLAEDSKLGRQVALKMPRFADVSSRAMERFNQEARSAATLTHPNICPIHDVGEYEGTKFISMAYIEGSSLAEELAGGVTRTDRQIAELVRKLALALEEAHHRGIIHRDIKPPNIMIDRRREPILMDFGLARQMYAGSDSRLTREGTIIGSPAYMSPEQVHGDRPVGPPSDIYSLGVVLFELMTGRVPFEGSVTGVIGQVLHVDPPSIVALRPESSEQLVAICKRAMKKDPADRFTSMHDFAAALTAFIDSTTPPGIASGTSEKSASSGSGSRRRWIWVAYCAGGLLAAFGLFHLVAGWFGHPFGPPGRDSGFLTHEEVMVLTPREAFTRLDTNNDGHLDNNELLPHIGQRADADGDHQITWEEYEQAATKLGPALHDPPGRNERPGARKSRNSPPRRAADSENR